ncbi:N-acetylgalactosamine kinase isoform X2 [Orussus abietinus]|uniref:N-acetylgalactosamine kinase isoform X2 n=1 Tax=Orussus abietinus TaxID=222816 RepID=UPI000626B521|nr:N-acetylgalactosamine kinase isoform X2 [Orussus abietinus]
MQSRERAMSKKENGSGDDCQVPILCANASLRSRLNPLVDRFRSKFDKEPTFFVRVPGRVNLIGEHVDYCGYSVCPMAIEQDILLAVASSDDDQLRLTNLDPRYEDFHCDLENLGACIENKSTGPGWHKYFLCGVRGAVEAALGVDAPPGGMLAAVWGNIPPKSGLSSSSALVSAAALATIHAGQRRLPKEEIATLCAEAERYIGTQGGGMDQAIAFLGKAGTAKLIDFNPLHATDVTLPEDAVFVIAHSLTYHNKASTKDYNLRVAECRMAAQIIAKSRNQDWKAVQKLIDVQKLLDKTLEEMAAIAMEDLPETPYTLSEICDILGTSQEQLQRVSHLSPFEDSQTFKLRQRAIHVFQANRVQAFRRVNEDATMNEQDKLCQLGSLMSKSHASLHQLYECSNPSVDALVEAALQCGALGARLTGAGWGGCVVAIVRKSEVAEFLEAMQENFYKSRDTSLDKKHLLFPTEPNQGAAIYIN